MKVVFINGSEVEIAPEDVEFFMRKFRDSGIRYFFSKRDNKTIPFTSPSIAYIDHGDERPRTVGEMEKEKAEIVRLREEREMAKRDKLARSEEEIRKAALEKAEKEFMAKANCTHKAEDGTTLRSMYYTDTVNGRKFFPVCDFCGHRERYIGLKKIEEGKVDWTIEDIENAKPYEG